MPSSHDQVVLQAADLLVWTAQRDARSDGLKAARRWLAERACDRLVSRAMSETFDVRAARVRQSERLPFPFAAEAKGRAMLGELERARRERVREVRDRTAG